MSTEDIELIAKDVAERGRLEHIVWRLGLGLVTVSDPGRAFRASSVSRNHHGPISLRP